MDGDALKLKLWPRTSWPKLWVEDCPDWWVWPRGCPDQHSAWRPDYQVTDVLSEELCWPRDCSGRETAMTDVPGPDWSLLRPPIDVLGPGQELLWLKFAARTERLLRYMSCSLTTFAGRSRPLTRNYIYDISKVCIIPWPRNVRTDTQRCLWLMPRYWVVHGVAQVIQDLDERVMLLANPSTSVTWMKIMFAWPLTPVQIEKLIRVDRFFFVSHCTWRMYFSKLQVPDKLASIHKTTQNVTSTPYTVTLRELFRSISVSFRDGLCPSLASLSHVMLLGLPHILQKLSFLVDRLRLHTCLLLLDLLSLKENISFLAQRMGGGSHLLIRRFQRYC